jgi:hypothetical protein
MVFQIQQGSETHGCSQAVWNDASVSVTTDQALAALFVGWMQCEKDLRIKSHPSVMKMAKWIGERPPRGVEGVGTVKQVYFRFRELEWRVDAENYGGWNLRR